MRRRAAVAQRHGQEATDDAANEKFEARMAKMKLSKEEKRRLLMRRRLVS